MRFGIAQDVVDAPMMVQINAYREEAFFTGNFTPLRGVDGAIEGFYNALFEVTAQKILDRRKKMLGLLGTPADPSWKGVFTHIIASLATNPLDIPMVIIYEADTGEGRGKTTLHVRGQLGIPEGHKLLLDEQNLDDVTGIMPLCQQATLDRVIIAPDERFDGVEWLGFNQAPKTVAVMALRADNNLFGFLVVGTNPYRPFDDACDEYLSDMTRTSSSILASAWAAENLRENQQRLQNDLEFSDMKVRHLVAHASVGMAHANPDGMLLWANDKFLSLTSSSPAVDNTIDSIFDVFMDDEKHKIQEVWTAIFDHENHVSAELRLKQLFQPPVGDAEPTQTQILAFPFKENGITVSGMACVTDIVV